MILGVILQPIGDTIQQLFYNIHGMDLSFHRDNTRDSTPLQDILYDDNMMKIFLGNAIKASR